MSRWLFILVVLIAVLVCELIIWLGYSWVIGTVVAVAMVLGYFVLMSRRPLKR